MVSACIAINTLAKDVASRIANTTIATAIDYKSRVCFHASHAHINIDNE